MHTDINIFILIIGLHYEIQNLKNDYKINHY